MKILLVDDDPLNLALMELILQKFDGEFATASNGREALEKLKSFQPDIVFLDIMMPEINGYEVCRKLKADPQTKHIPVIMLTSFSDRESRLNGLDAGADDFISKPLDAQELLARTKNFLKMKEYRDEIVAKNAELNRLVEFKKDLTDMIVHDLKAPLTCIRGYIDLAIEDTDDSASRLNSLLQAKKFCFSLLSMLTTLLDVGSMEDGKMSLSYSTVDVSNLFRRVQDMFFSLAENEGKKIVFDIPLSSKIYADENLLERVLQNLVSNALRHVGRGRGEVSFSLAEEEDRYVFSVSDNGSGIPPEFHEKIFDKYGQTGEISDNPVSGINKGLGLTFCKLVVEAHGGKIWVESDSGKGSIFRFTILKR